MILYGAHTMVYIIGSNVAIIAIAIIALVKWELNCNSFFCLGSFGYLREGGWFCGTGMHLCTICIYELYW